MTLWLKTKIYQHLPAFKSRNFRLFFTGQTMSLSGTFMTQVTISWVIYDLTKSSWLLGLTGFLQFLPTVLLTPFSGVLCDRWNQKKLLILVQILGLMVSTTLTTLTFLGLIKVWLLITVAILGGMLKGLDMPVRYAIVINTVDERNHLGNAIALYSAMLSSSLLIGPAVGGILLASVGAKYCFLYDSISYIIALITLGAMKLRPKIVVKGGKTANTWKKLQEGWEYVFKNLAIRSILILLTFHGLVGISYMAILPVFAGYILQGDGGTMGMLSAASSIGSLMACVYLSLRREVLGLEKLMASCPIAIGFGLIAFGLSKTTWLSLLVLTVIGGSGMLQVSCGNTIIQTLVEDDKRGRVMSLYSLAIIGTLPLGNLIVGSLAQNIGAPNTVIGCGIFCLLESIWFNQQLPLLRGKIRETLILSTSTLETGA
ncbi:MFS transporter [Cylindrospermopsis raciborskii S07]|uniref:MFS transporter n=2 Tax=Cylindrospermopsis TaxID=77021 RepID=A0A7H0EX60_9CYAN|nr:MULTISPECIES: MFS transporter [Cylindrospermopsis]OBU74938.1 MFS transporter [Cylindrospermopsis raciborskii CS-505]PNK04217.1 MFS transporter [Cylindrospermopsis raciborskii S14]PNK04978.1 MFS transporter [Cylindrospermopsis raciborskii S07]PNK05659.1 MFS transporter [Cylindrospermopsis raciborskii S10]PNK17540.1 MFS transporter [Cylindrospermopsis raciborskii S06]